MAENFFVTFIVLATVAVVSSFDGFAMQRTKCIPYCPESNELVCGTDDKTYPSRCHLWKAACEQRRNIRIAHPGECECPTSCLRNYQPCCVSYKGVEKTYPNLCEFKRERCKIKDLTQTLEYKRPGPCKPWKSWKNCPEGCRDLYAPICGGDNVTYSSVCALKITACRLKKKIKISVIGPCSKGKKCPDFCPFTYRPICGNDGILYPSECEMKLTACKAGKVVRRAKKDQKMACKRKCALYCPDVEVPVCGPDSVTYLNMCVAKKAYCVRGKFLKTKDVKKGRCAKMSNNTPIKKKK